MFGTRYMEAGPFGARPGLIFVSGARSTTQAVVTGWLAPKACASHATYHFTTCNWDLELLDNAAQPNSLQLSKYMMLMMYWYVVVVVCRESALKPAVVTCRSSNSNEVASIENTLNSHDLLAHYIYILVNIPLHATACI